MAGKAQRLVEVQDACNICELGKRAMSVDQARACGHIILEGDNMPLDDRRRQYDIKRVAEVGLDFFGADQSLRDAAVACIDAHLDGTCEHIKDMRTIGD